MKKRRGKMFSLTTLNHHHIPTLQAGASAVRQCDKTAEQCSVEVAAKSYKMLL